MTYCHAESPCSRGTHWWRRTAWGRSRSGCLSGCPAWCSETSSQHWGLLSPGVVIIQVLKGNISLKCCFTNYFIAQSVLLHKLLKNSNIKFSVQTMLKFENCWLAAPSPSPCLPCVWLSCWTSAGGEKSHLVTDRQSGPGAGRSCSINRL